MKTLVQDGLYGRFLYFSWASVIGRKYALRLLSAARVQVTGNGKCLPNSNGMDSSSPKRHLGARLEVLITSNEREGVHYEQA